MLTFIAKTKEEAYKKIESEEWLLEAVWYLRQLQKWGSYGHAFTLGLALELFEVSLDHEYIDHYRISFGDTPFTKKCKEMITTAYYVAKGSCNVNATTALCQQSNKIRAEDVRKKLNNIREGIYLESDIDDIEKYIIETEQRIGIKGESMVKEENSKWLFDDTGYTLIGLSRSYVQYIYRNGSNENNIGAIKFDLTKKKIEVVGQKPQDKASKIDIDVFIAMLVQAKELGWLDKISLEHKSELKRVEKL